uniref:Uncharacterized protein n=1 Tax=Anguilla anguilla TaxID=7936 RepID=A0A0E9QVV9_ANGAN
MMIFKSGLSGPITLATYICTEMVPVQNEVNQDSNH